ncbi:MAG TPA: MFS transporter [Solirubrobacteraceae bacterium]|jgi:predicted MFS family arabinose efflux permease
MSQYLRVLRYRDFRYLFLGQSASAVGDQVVIVALALYITQRTGSPTDLGLVLAAQSLPLIGLILFGGVWADRLPRHRIMTAADYARALLHGVLAVSIALGGASVAEMIVIEALFGAARAFFQPAYSGLLPQTIPDRLAQDARALSSTTENGAILVGPALGAALVLTVGAGAAFALDAATFVLSAELLRHIRPRARGEALQRETVMHELRAGWREVRSRTWVWATIAAFTGAVLCAYAQWYALAPVVSRDLYGSAGVFGLLESVAGAGAVVGALVGIRWRPRRPMVVGLVLTLFWPLQTLAFAAAAPLAGVVALAFGAGLGFTLFEVWWATALVRNIPPQALSRVSAYDWMGSLALLPLGFAIAGPLASAWGARTVLSVGAAAALVMLLLALLPGSTRRLAGTGSAEQLEDDVAVEARGEAEIADVDALVRVVHERGGL